LATRASVKGHPLFTKRAVKARLLIVIASDRGLAGAFNSNLTRLYTQELIRDREQGVKTSTITIGRKAAQFVARLKDTEVLGSYQDLSDRPDATALQAILETARSMFTAGEVDAVDLLFTDFVSSVTQTAIVQRVLPAGAGVSDVEAVSSLDVIYEPSVQGVLDGVTFRLVTA